MIINILYLNLNNFYIATFIVILKKIFFIDKKNNYNNNNAYNKNQI
jgi:hypothetical protein